MENIVKIADKNFSLYIEQDNIENSIKEVAEKLNNDYKGKEVLFVVVLNGAFMFAGELMKHVSLNCKICFVRLSSYIGQTTSGKIQEVIGLTEDINQKNIVIVEDIVDTGLTMKTFTEQLKEMNGASIEICSMLHKPDALKYKDMRPKYIAMEIPNEFIIGYGLDYDGYGRNLKDIYKVI